MPIFGMRDPCWQRLHATLAARHVEPAIVSIARIMTKIAHGCSGHSQGHSRSAGKDRRQYGRVPGREMRRGLFRTGLGVVLSYLRAARKSCHAPALNGSSGLVSVLESRTRTVLPSRPTSTHAPPLPPLKLDFRQQGSRVSIARSPLFGSGRGMLPWGVLPIVLVRTCRGSWLPGSAHR